MLPLGLRSELLSFSEEEPTTTPRASMEWIENVCVGVRGASLLTFGLLLLMPLYTPLLWRGQLMWMGKLAQLKTSSTMNSQAGFGGRAHVNRNLKPPWVWNWPILHTMSHENICSDLLSNKISQNLSSASETLIYESTESITEYGFVNSHSISYKGGKVNLCNFSRCSVETLCQAKIIFLSCFDATEAKTVPRRFDITNKCLPRKTSAAGSAARFKVWLNVHMTTKQEKQSAPSGFHFCSFKSLKSLAL